MHNFPKGKSMLPVGKIVPRGRKICPRDSASPQRIMLPRGQIMIPREVFSNQLYHNQLFFVPPFTSPWRFTGALGTAFRAPRGPWGPKKPEKQQKSPKNRKKRRIMLKLTKKSGLALPKPHQNPPNFEKTCQGQLSQIRFPPLIMVPP